MTPTFLTRRAKILFLDAHDSFSNNIVAQVEQCVDAEVVKIRIDEPVFAGYKDADPRMGLDLSTGSVAFVEYLKTFDAIIAGPGPGSAQCEQDVGLINELWKLQDADLLPVLGICLGFQSMCLAFGANIERLRVPRHGLVSEILHKGQSIFTGVDQLLATQYHSLQVNIEHPIQTKRAVQYPAELWNPTESCPQLEPLAWDFDERRNGAVLMAAKHVQKPFWGVQFHPESICTNSEGTRIIQNWWTSAQAWNRKRAFNHVSRNNSITPFQTSPMTIGGFRNFLRLHNYDPPNIGGSVASYPWAYKMALSGAISGKETYGPEDIAPLIAHGDGQSLPDLPPDTVHCATTGSGRLTVSDVCELFDIPHNETIILESGLQPDLLPMRVGTGRYSIVGLIIPGETLRLHYYAGTQVMQLRNGKDEVHLEFHVTDPWAYIKAVMQHLKPNQTPPGPTFAPFWGGLMGYASYEAGLEAFECHPGGEETYPDICFAYITRSIVFDHQVKKIYVQSIRGKDDKPWVNEVLEKIYEAVGQKSQSSTPNPTPMSKANPFEQDAVLNKYLDSCNHLVAERASYCEKVALCQRIIASGESYELCLTAPNEIRARQPKLCRKARNELSWKLYKRLTKQNPAPFGAYLRLHNVHVLSSSPERYISWDRNQSAQCRPIKGTVQKKHGVTRADADAILSSSKERAENLMIVDLVRHQLHGVYGSGNVHVRQLMEVEEYETLWQLVTVIDAIPPGVPKARTPEEWEQPADYVSGMKAKDETDMLGFEAFLNSLPPGSMTGAPKKRSCQILYKLERQRRGIYSGVLGYFDVGGAGDFSVVIRTAVKFDDPKDESEKEDVWRVGAGGAVTSQSTPEAEYEEMKAKFQSTSRAFQHVPPSTALAPLAPPALGSVHSLSFTNGEADLGTFEVSVVHDE